MKPFDVSPYWTVYTTFILYNTVYQSENLRGALRSVDHGQYEAAVAMGMTPFCAFTLKVVDMFAKAEIFSALYNRRTEPYIGDAIAYWAVAILLTLFFNWWEKRLRSKGF